MQDNFDAQMKEYGLNALHFFGLFILLFIPTTLGVFAIKSLNLVQLNQNLPIFMMIAFILLIYFGQMAYFSNKLIGRFQDLVSVKYLVVIILIFVLMADVYNCYRYADAYLEYQPLIKRRAIVWSDVPVLPLDVQYSDFSVAYMAIVTFLRGCVMAFFLFILMQGNIENQPSPISRQRKRLRKKPVEDLKATVHPSVLKKYEKNKE